MIKHALMLAAAVLVAGCNSGASQSAENTVGGANVVTTAQAPLTKGTTSLSLDSGKNAQAGQVAIADVISFGGPNVTITAPAGWQLIRDDASPVTRQSLYWHAVQANDSSATWTFGEPVDAQGAVLLLDNVASGAPVDITTGNKGTGGTVTAPSVATTTDGDLVLSFFASDFARPDLQPSLPENAKTVIIQEKPSHEYWILAIYQTQLGSTDDQVSNASQLFNWTAAQVAIKKGTATP
jgi:hypothetical protein